ncbi:MAG: APC family permease [Pseudomonadota bacterium]
MDQGGDPLLRLGHDAGGHLLACPVTCAGMFEGTHGDDAETEEQMGTRAPAEPSLKRSLSLPLLTLYGLGVTVGAGIYVLIGATVAEAGPHAWFAFLLAAFVISFTALSYAELSTRYPVSAGEAVYVEKGFDRRLPAICVGGLVALAGVVSSAAISVGSAGYLSALTGLPDLPLIAAIVVLMGLVAFWGISESVTIAAIITVVEILGLMVVIIWGFAVAPPNGVALSDLALNTEMEWNGLIAASVLAFFAFIGFEDMVNVAEEVREPRRTMPRAVIITLVLATLIYVAVCAAVLVAVPVSDLAGATAPLSLVFADAPRGVATAFAAIAVVATANGVLIQMIMASRVLYGMADRGQLPKGLAKVSPRTRTPGRATALVTVIILVLALALPIEALAARTSQIVLFIFTVVNIALVAIKVRLGSEGDFFKVPVLVPLCGVVTSAGLLMTALV